jgi:hypothetical protein
MAGIANMEKLYWQSKNEPIAIDNMTEAHVKNVLKMLIRNKRIVPLRTERDNKWSHLYYNYLENLGQES